MTTVNFLYNNIPHQLYCHNDLIKNIITRNNTYFEDWLLTPLMSKVKSFNFTIDIGANIGNHAHFFKNVCKADTVICFEPLIENFELLKLNCPSCTLFNYGISSYDGVAYMQHPDGLDNNSGTAHISTQGKEVQVRQLDSCDFKNVTFIKIDVEGHELEVLKGGANTIATYTPDLLIEIHTGINFEDVLKLLPQGYSYERVGPETHYLFKFTPRHDESIS